MNVTKTLELSRVDFPVVNSLKNLEVGRIYSTTNYKMLLPLGYNRGVKTGIVTSKVTKIREMIQTGAFYMGVIHVMVNLKGQRVDGNHRCEALRLEKKPVNFIITAQPEFNCDNPSDILNNVSEFNEINSSWSDTDAYMSALGFKEPAAMAIFNVKEYVEKEGVDAKIFTPARIIALVTKFKGGLAGRKQKRSVYCDDSIADKINSPEFYKQIDELVELIKYLSTFKDTTPWFYVRAIMPIVWDGFLTIEKIHKRIIKKGFDLDSDKMRDVKEYVEYIAEDLFRKRFR